MNGKQSRDLSEPSSSSAASCYRGMSSKISVIEGIRQKAKREVEFQLHAFETKSRYRGHDVETVKHVRRTKVHRMSADDEKELRKQVKRSVAKDRLDFKIQIFEEELWFDIKRAKAKIA